MIDRILSGTVDTIQATALETGTTPDSATVTIIRQSDNLTIAFNATATPAGDGVFTYEVDATATAQPDVLSAVWSFTAGGVAQGSITTTHEIVGGFLFTIAQARAALGDSAYESAKIQEARVYAETEIERALGFALVPRYTRESFSAVSNRPIRLRPYVRAIRSASVAGTPLSAGDLATLTYSGVGFLYGYSWPAGYGNVTVAYEHGLDAGNDLLPGAQRYALAAAVEYLGGGTGSIDPRAERLITDDGTIVYGSTSGGQFRAVGVNEWVAANRLPVIA